MPDALLKRAQLGRSCAAIVDEDAGPMGTAEKPAAAIPLDLAVTEGIVNSLSGARGDTTQHQLQAPIQPGNRGRWTRAAVRP